MNGPTADGAGRSGGTVIAAVCAGILALLLLLPSGGADTQPPECWAYLLYRVPCEGWVAPLVGLVTASLVGLAFWRGIDRRRRPSA